MIRYVGALLFLCTSLFAYEDYSKLATAYAHNPAAGSNYLAFRDIPNKVHCYFPSGENLSILDYGCGTGLSTRFIKQLFPESSSVVGVDISSDMLQQAILADPHGTYLQIKQTIPFSNSSFDLVYLSFVLFELPSKEEITRMLAEIRRTMKSGAYLIATASTPEMYNRKNHWATLDPDFPENDNLESGKLAKVSSILPDGEVITFTDYYWTEKDYRDCFAAAGFSFLSVDYPLGSKNEPVDWKWKDETRIAPFQIFVFKNV